MKLNILNEDDPYDDLPDKKDKFDYNNDELNYVLGEWVIAGYIVTVKVVNECPKCYINNRLITSKKIMKAILTALVEEHPIIVDWYDDLFGHPYTNSITNNELAFLFQEIQYTQQEAERLRKLGGGLYET